MARDSVDLNLFFMDSTSKNKSIYKKADFNSNTVWRTISEPHEKPLDALESGKKPEHSVEFFSTFQEVIIYFTLNNY